jgi:hypothetical protein
MVSLKGQSSASTPLTLTRHCITSRCLKKSFLNTAKMSDTLLQIASRVQAAVEAYVSVRDFANKEQWENKFKGELVSTH